MNPFRKFVSDHVRLLRSSNKLPLRTVARLSRPQISPGAPKVLIFSPHPDDECIVGGLALRLLRKAKWNVINVAVTLGSIRERRTARLRELQKACASLGFGLVVPDKLGLERINLESRSRNRGHWREAVTIIARVLAEHRPRVILVPHEHDCHETHLGTHLLVLDALKTLPRSFKCHVVETEYWGQMKEPNLLIEIRTNELADLIAALACHVGEVRRNAHHARLPAWMMDNVRRGAELVGGQGRAAPDFAFATIYGLRKWTSGRMVDLFAKGKVISQSQNAATLFRS